MTERTYLVGLPVLVTVRDDGTVTYDVDTAETGEAIREEYWTDQGRADAEIVEAEHAARHPLPE